MPTLPIPFTSLDKSADKATETASLPQNQQDGYWQQTMTSDSPKFLWCRRPGVTTVGSLESGDDGYGVTGIYEDGTTGIAVKANGEVWSFNSSGVVADLKGTSTISGAHPVSIVKLGSKFFICGNLNNNIASFTATAASGADLADAQAPTTVNSMAVLNNVLVAVNWGSTRFDYSDAGDGEAWSGLYANCEQHPGNIFKVLSANGVLYFFKNKYIEIWGDNGSEFERISSAIVNMGVLNTYGVIEVDGVIYFLGEDFNFYRLIGYNVERLPGSENFCAYVKSFSSYLPRTFYLPISNKKLVVWNFTGNQAIVYDIDLQQWYQWGQWNSGTGAYDRYTVQCAVQKSADSVVYAGDFDEDTIFTISGSTDDSTAIRTVLQTDFIDRGQSDTFKYCHELILLFKRTNISSGTPKSITVNYRDEGSTTWSSDYTVALEAVNYTDLKANIRRLGRYKRRMWRFIMSEASDAALMEVQERFDYGA